MFKKLLRVELRLKLSIHLLISDGFAIVLRMIDDSAKREFSASLMVEGSDNDTEADN
jgi:hypothetical protein